MANSKYKVGDRVKFVSRGAMFGNAGTVMLVRKDGHLIVHFDEHPEGSSLFVDLTDVAPERRVTAGAEPINLKSRAQIKRGVDEILARPSRNAPTFAPQAVTFKQRALEDAIEHVYNRKGSEDLSLAEACEAVREVLPRANWSLSDLSNGSIGAKIKSQIPDWF